MNKLLGRSLLMFIVLFSSSSASFSAAAESKAELKELSRTNFETVNTELASLLKEFYPRAKTTKSDGKIHFEFKLHKYATISGRQELAPTLDGILGDLEIVAGKYKGKKVLPLTTNETLYVVLEMAPYLKEDDCHLFCKLIYPHTVPNTFLIKFKELVKEFDRNPRPRRSDSGTAENEGEDRTDTVDNTTDSQGSLEPGASAESSETAGTARTKEDSDSAQDAPDEPSSPGQSETSKGESDKANVADADRESKEDPSKETDLAAALMSKGSSNGEDQAEASEGSGKHSEDSSGATAPDSGVLDGKDTDDIFAMAANAEKEAKKGDSKPRVKPTKKYFNSWFALYYQTVYKARDASQILMQFYSRNFRQPIILNYHKFSPAERKLLLKNLKESTYMTEWRVDRLQPGPGGCEDIFVYGRVAGRFPSYLIHRMVWEEGTWRIDSGRGRFWYNR